MCITGHDIGIAWMLVERTLWFIKSDCGQSASGDVIFQITQIF